jgi:hypothetical protein
MLHDSLPPPEQQEHYPKGNLIKIDFLPSLPNFSEMDFQKKSAKTTTVKISARRIAFMHEFCERLESGRS